MDISLKCEQFFFYCLTCEFFHKLQLHISSDSIIVQTMRSDFFSDATQLRMIRLYLYLKTLDLDWQNIKLTSEELAEAIQTTATTVRKDLSSLECSAEGWGYQVNRLIPKLKESLLLNHSVRTGIAGLEPWGFILLSRKDFFPGVEVAAGFDSSMNRIEMTSASVPLHPSYEITDVFNRMELLLGIISSYGENAQQTADRMIKGGAMAILNLTPCPVRVPENVFMYQADFQSGILKLLSSINGSLQNKE